MSEEKPKEKKVIIGGEKKPRSAKIQTRRVRKKCCRG